MRIASVIALACLLAGPASAVEWVERVGSAQLSSSVGDPRALPLPDGGFLLRDTAATYRYAADGSLVQRGEPLLLDGLLLGPAPDGVDLQTPEPALVFPTPFQLPECRFARVDGAHDVRLLGDQFRPPAGINPADPTGAQYVSRRGESPALLRIDPDCHRTVLEGLGGVDASANAQDAPGAFVLVTAAIGTAGSAPAAAPAEVAPPTEQRLLRITPQGDTLWATPLPGRYTGLVVDAVGVLLAGEGDSASASHHLARVDLAGTLAWSTELAVEPGPVAALHGSADGGAIAWLLHEAEGVHGGSVVRVDAAGDAVVQSLGTQRLQARVAGPAPQPAWLVGQFVDEAWTDRRVVRVAADGSLQLLRELGDDEDVLFQLQDGRLLLVDRSAAAEAAFALFDPATGGSAPFTVPVGAPRSEITAVAHADGLTALVASDLQGSNRLRLLDGDGALLWERELTPDRVGSADTILPLRLAFSGDAICATHVRPEVGTRNPGYITCAARSDGGITVPLLEVEPAVAWPPVLLGADAERTLLYVRLDCNEGGGCTTHLVRRQLQGTAWATPVVLVTGGSGNQRELPVPVGDDGVALAWSGFMVGTDAILRVDAAGELAWSSPLPEGQRIDVVAGAPDGRVLRILRGDGQSVAEQLGPDGSVQWSQLLEGFHTAVATGVDDGWVLALRGNASSELRQLAAADGATAWSQPRGTPTVQATEVLALASTDQGIAALRATGAGARLEWISAQGALLGADAVADPAGPFEAPQLLAAGGGVLAAGVDGQDALLGRSEPPQSAPITPTLLGSWYAPQSTGQGLFLGTAGDDAVYGGWFTYAPDGENDRADQRWYTLQGSLADAGPVALDILETRGGAFASAPAPVTTVVGSATLLREDCSHAQLVYQFQPGHLGGAVGAIALQRIAPFDCAAAAVATTLPSGAFYDPATSGQGVFFEPVAAGAQVLLAGLWFTFDPTGAADDPSAQHWFTLDSAPVDANADRVQLSIYRSIGGRFDGRPTENTHRVGTATVQVQDCTTLTLSWQFDATHLAGHFAGLEGEQGLQRISACP